MQQKSDFMIREVLDDILDNEKDLKLKEYQENYNNIDKIQNFIDEKNDYLLKQF